MRHATAWVLALGLAFPLLVRAAEETPYTADRDTVLLLRFDGDARDASGCGNDGKVIGDAMWAEGRFGKALSVQGKGGVTVNGSESLTIADRNWTVEAWIKPAKEQGAHAPIVAGFASPAWYFIRLSGGRYLYASFECGPGGNAASADMSAKLLDGNWHQVAMVLDRDRGGEVRVYLDGVNVTDKSASMPYPIHSRTQTTIVTVGLSVPWLLQGGFTGLIDEVRVSKGVREAYRVGGATPRSASAPVAPLVADVNPPPVSLDPKTTVILRSPATSAGEQQMVGILQKSLRRLCGVASGFEIVGDEKSVPAGAFVLAIGPGPWVPIATLANLEGRDFTLLRIGNRLVMTGSVPTGTVRAMVRFLDEFCGVRFYMPTDLFTSLPANGAVTVGAVNVLDKPRVRDIHMGMFGNLPEEQDWLLCNGVGIRPPYITSHSMMQRFPPARFSERYPEIYPILKVQRHIPKSASDHGWQPCFSEPKLLDAAEEEALEWFRRNPSVRAIPYAVQDSHAFCECPRCQEIIRKTGDKTQAYSNMFWGFLNQLAERLEKRLPEYDISNDKVLIGMAYSEVRMAPPFKLHRNVMAYPVFTVGDLLIDKVMEPEGVDGVWRKAASQMGQYDWAQGDGYYIPRLYGGLATRLFNADHVYTLATAETYPNWGLDGPKYWMLVKIWDNPGADAKKLYEQFCADMFGPAQKEMLEYFLGLEELWISMDNDAERKLFKWVNQFNLRPPQQEMVRAARERLNKAAALAETPDQKKRVELFSKTFRLSEMIFDVANAATLEAARVAELRKYAAEVIAPDKMTMSAFGQGGPTKDYVVSRVNDILNVITAKKPVK